MSGCNGIMLSETPIPDKPKDYQVDKGQRKIVIKKKPSECEKLELPTVSACQVSSLERFADESHAAVVENGLQSTEGPHIRSFKICSVPPKRKRFDDGPTFSKFSLPPPAIVHVPPSALHFPQVALASSTANIESTFSPLLNSAIEKHREQLLVANEKKLASLLEDCTFLSTELTQLYATVTKFRDCQRLTDEATKAEVEEMRKLREAISKELSNDIKSQTIPHISDVKPEAALSCSEKVWPAASEEDDKSTLNSVVSNRRKRKDSALVKEKIMDSGNKQSLEVVPRHKAPPLPSSCAETPPPTEQPSPPPSNLEPYESKPVDSSKAPDAGQNSETKQMINMMHSMLKMMTAGAPAMIPAMPPPMLPTAMPLPCSAYPPPQLPTIDSYGYFHSPMPVIVPSVPVPSAPVVVVSPLMPISSTPTQVAAAVVSKPSNTTVATSHINGSTLSKAKMEEMLRELDKAIQLKKQLDSLGKQKTTSASTVSANNIGCTLSVNNLDPRLHRTSTS